MAGQSSSPMVWIVLGILALVLAVVISLFVKSEPKAVATTPGGAAPTAVLTIAVIPKGTTHEYWKTIHAGANKAAQELKAAGTPIEIIWKGPLKEDDRASQIDVVQNFVTQEVSGIVLAPLDRTALKAPVELAISSKIPVVIIDSSLESDKPASFIATNSFEGGRQGGKRLAEVMGGKGKAIMMRYEEGSASTEQREAGFLDAMKAFPDIQLISIDQHAGATRETALTTGQNLLNRYKDEVTGIFCPNESTGTGMLIALRDAGLNGKVKYVAFDASKDLLDGLRKGDIQGLVVQDPFNMGYLGVKNLVAVIQGKKVDKQIDTPVKLVTPENIDQSDIKDLINPPLDKYLLDASAK